MKAETYEMEVAPWMACPIEYGDFSGVSKEDERAIEKFVYECNRIMSDLCAHSWHVEWPEDGEYSFKRNPWTGLGDSVATATVTFLI